MDQEGDLRQRVVVSIETMLPRVLNREIAAGSEDVQLFDELGMSSSKTLELLLALEDDLDIHIDVENIDRENLASIRSLADFVTAHSLVGE